MSDELKQDVAEQQIPAPTPSKTPEEVALMKQQYGKVWFIVIGGQEYYYRPLTRKEYKDVYSNEEMIKDRFALEQAIVQRCLISPTLDVAVSQGSEAGVLSVMSEAILAASSFVPDSEPVQL